MKKFFVTAGSVLVLTAILYVAAIYLSLKLNLSSTPWMPNVPKLLTGVNKGSSLVKFREAGRQTNVDFLVLGSSHSYRGFDPRIFKANGLNMFNLGSNSQTPTNSYYLLKEYIDEMKPKYVILETYFNASMVDGVEPTLDIVSNHPLTWNIVKMSFANYDIMVLNNLIANYLNRLENPIEKEEQRKTKEVKFRPETYVPGGYVQYNDSGNVIGPKGLAEIEKTTIELLPRHERHLKKIIDLCREYNAQLIFVSAPITDEYLAKVTNYQEFYNQLSFIAKANNIPYFDYNTGLRINLSSLHDFHDRSHLAQSGVEKFNAIFIQDLKKYLSQKAGNTK